MTEAILPRRGLRIFANARSTLSSEVRSISSNRAVDGNCGGGLRSSPIILNDAASLLSKASPMKPLLPDDNRLATFRHADLGTYRDENHTKVP
jgi:hypothetical protein